MAKKESAAAKKKRLAAEKAALAAEVAEKEAAEAAETEAEEHAETEEPAETEAEEPKVSSDPVVKVEVAVEEPESISVEEDTRPIEVKLILIALAEYEEYMDYVNGWPIEDRMKKQIRLYRALQNAFTLEQPHLSKMITHLVGVFKEDKVGVYSKTVAFPFSFNIR